MQKFRNIKTKKLENHLTYMHNVATDCQRPNIRQTYFQFFFCSKLMYKVWSTNKGTKRYQTALPNNYIHIMLIKQTAVSCGVHVVYMWCTCGALVVYIWCTCGVHGVYMWCTWGVFVVYMRCTCGVHMVYMWCTCGADVVYM